MKIISKIVLFAGLAMATQTPTSANSDEYNVFYRDTARNVEWAQIKIVEVPNVDVLRQRAAEFKMPASNRIRAFSLWNRDTNRCYIFVVKPKNGTIPEANNFGHELMHCFYGDWHKDQD